MPIVKEKRTTRIRKPAVEAVSRPVVVQPQKERYIEAVGRRKTSVARVRLYPDRKVQGFHGEINGKPLEIYFPLEVLRKKIFEPFEIIVWKEGMALSVKVNGGGFNSQIEAVRHGIAKALVKLDLGFRKRLKAAGFLRRDPRMKERKKPGLKRARKAPQWAKR